MKAATSSVQPVSVGYYGYLWWLTSVPHDLYRADGRGGQTILILPQQNLVVVTTGGGGRDLNRVLETLLTAHIVPAIESATPLPVSPDGVASLEAKTDGNQTAWLIGLDNVFRFSPGRYGLTASAKGWWETDNVFVLHLDEIGNIDQRRISASFEDDQVTLQIQDLTGLGGVTLVGWLEG